MEEVTKPTPGYSTETIADNQGNSISKKIKEIFRHLDPADPPEICPIRDVLSPVSDKWSILIVSFLGIYHKLRFNALKKNVYGIRSEEHTSELQSLTNLVCRLLLEKKKIHNFFVHRGS